MTKKTTPCKYCGEPITIATGGMKRFKNPVTGLLGNPVKMPDQVAEYHKGCRKEGRRMANKQRKASRA